MIALSTDLEIWPTLPNFYTGCQKVQNLAFETLWFRNEATYRLSFVFTHVSKFGINRFAQLREKCSTNL